MPTPKYHGLFTPTLQALRHLGGSASIPELEEEVIRILGLTNEEVAEPHDERRTKLEYRLAWARTYLKTYGLIGNSERGVWVLTPKGKEAGDIDPLKIRRFVREQNRTRRQKQTEVDPEAPLGIDMAEVAEAVLEQTWREELLTTLFNLKSDAFERLCQRVLRESGFTQVKVTGRSGDGGIDGVGLVRLGGLLSFPVLFQCKRYRGVVGPSTIRDFRGAMVGRADRGLVMTTGTFSRDARMEATRDGAPPIDLVDSEQLIDKLKELRLGVEVEMKEDVTVLTEWFKHL